MGRTAFGGSCAAFLIGAFALAPLAPMACARAATSGRLAQLYGADAGGVPSPMPNTPLYDAGVAPLPSITPSTPTGAPSPGNPPGVPPGTPTSPGTPSTPGQGPIVPLPQ
jgi:hypothetical protein